MCYTYNTVQCDVSQPVIVAVAYDKPPIWVSCNTSRTVKPCTCTHAVYVAWFTFLGSSQGCSRAVNTNDTDRVVFKVSDNKAVHAPFSHVC